MEKKFVNHSVEVDVLDVLEEVVFFLGQNGHCHLGFEHRELIRTVAFHGPDRHHVVQWRECVAVMGQDAEAEVLGVAFRCGQQPEPQLARQQGGEMPFGLDGSLKHRATTATPGPPSPSYFRCEGKPFTWQKSSCVSRMRTTFTAGVQMAVKSFHA